MVSDGVFFLGEGWWGGQWSGGLGAGRGFWRGGQRLTGVQVRFDFDDDERGRMKAICKNWLKKHGKTKATCITAEHFTTHHQFPIPTLTITDLESCKNSRSLSSPHTAPIFFTHPPPPPPPLSLPCHSHLHSHLHSPIPLLPTTPPPFPPQNNPRPHHIIRKREQPPVWSSTEDRRGSWFIAFLSPPPPLSPLSPPFNGAIESTPGGEGLHGRRSTRRRLLKR